MHVSPRATGASRSVGDDQKTHLSRPVRRLAAPGFAALAFWVALVSSSVYSWSTGNVQFMSKVRQRTTLLGAMVADEGAAFYALDTAPPAVVAWVRRWVHVGDCETDGTSFVVSCCRSSCGGFADRVRGISTLLLAAERSNRSLCLTRDYFVSAPVPKCDGGGSYVTVRDSSAGALVLFGDPANKSGAFTTIARNETNRFDHSIFRKVRYISSNMLSRIPAHILETPTARGDQADDARRVGMVAVAISRVLDEYMQVGKRTVEATVGVATRETPFVALHIRCGGSFFNTSRGQRIRAATWDTGFNFPTPDHLLRAAERISRRTVCKKPLFIARYGPAGETARPAIFLSFVLTSPASTAFLRKATRPAFVPSCKRCFRREWQDSRAAPLRSTLTRVTARRSTSSTSSTYLHSLSQTLCLGWREDMQRLGKLRGGGSRSPPGFWIRPQTRPRPPPSCATYSLPWTAAPTVHKSPNSPNPRPSTQESHATDTLVRCRGPAERDVVDHRRMTAEVARQTSRQGLDRPASCQNLERLSCRIRKLSQGRA
jgi:hypothetical protein